MPKEASQPTGGDQAPGRPRRTLPIIIAFWVRLALIGLVAAIIAGRLGAIEPTLDLAAHFQVQYLGGSLICLILCLLVRRWRWAALAALCVTVTAWQVVPWYLPPEGGRVIRPDSSTSALRVLLANVRTSNDRYEDVVALIEEAAPDVVVLQEVDERWLRGVKPIEADLPHVIAAPRADNFGIAVFSRRPLENAHTVYLGSAEVESIVGMVNVDGGRVTLIATHPVPPITRQLARLRNKQLDAVAGAVTGAPGSVMVVGDLNVTMWSAPYRRLIDVTGLCNARKGFGILPSWSMYKPFFSRIPIDHCLHSADLGIASCRLGEPIGSDHRPLIVDLVLPEGAVKSFSIP